MKVKAITFDFWRTLFRDTRNGERWKMRAEALAEVTGKPKEDAKDALKKVMSEFLRVHIAEQRTLVPQDAIPMVEASLDTVIAPECVESLKDAFARAILSLPPEPIEGALEAVRKAAERVGVGLVSDTGISPGFALEELLKSFGFLEHFDVLVFSDVVGVSKPQPAMFEEAAKGLGVRPEELLHIGDLEPTDIQGALDFGAKAALFCGDNERFAGATRADYTFKSWGEFVDRLPDFC